ncbi:hypothetical protein [uncultured Sphaerochaeta sp.]|uniref:hypothetical protein n=1 Tax=uncultured Sphaerochaeta sp. TaxID=886478 RepID=UPI00260CBDBF|nr:hypothetical protein [uncultured Sphaerochaeta sp.]
MREAIAFERNGYFPGEICRPTSLRAAIDQLSLCRFDIENLERFMDDSCKETHMRAPRFLGRIVFVATGKRMQGEARFRGKEPSTAPLKNAISMNASKYKSYNYDSKVIEELWKEITNEKGQTLDY